MVAGDEGDGDGDDWVRCMHARQTIAMVGVDCTSMLLPYVGKIWSSFIGRPIDGRRRNQRPRAVFCRILHHLIVHLPS